MNHTVRLQLSHPPRLSTRSPLLERQSLPFHPKRRVGIGTYLDIACGKSVVRRMVNLYQRGRKLYRSANVGGGQLYYKARSGVSCWPMPSKK